MTAVVGPILVGQVAEHLMVVVVVVTTMAATTDYINISDHSENDAYGMHGTKTKNLDKMP